MTRKEALEYLNRRVKMHPRAVTTTDLDMFINFSIQHNKVVPKNLSREMVKELAQEFNEFGGPIIIDILINSLCSLFDIHTNTINDLMMKVRFSEPTASRVVNYY